MTPFDEMTLGEVEEMTKLCLGGKSFQDADPMTLAGAVMYMTHRRDNPSLDWGQFRATVRMAEIKVFSQLMKDDDELDPIDATTS